MPVSSKYGYLCTDNHFQTSSISPILHLIFFVPHCHHFLWIRISNPKYLKVLTYSNDCLSNVSSRIVMFLSAKVSRWPGWCHTIWLWWLSRPRHRFRQCGLIRSCQHDLELSSEPTSSLKHRHRAMAVGCYQRLSVSSQEQDVGSVG